MNNPDINDIARLLLTSVRVQLRILERAQKEREERANSLVSNKADVMEAERHGNYVNALRNALKLFEGDRALSPTAAKLRVAEERIAYLESMRPVWTRGYSSDSVAAQVLTVALMELWSMLGANDQTEAVDKLKLVLNPQPTTTIPEQDEE